MSVIVTGMEVPRSCGGCEASGTGVCKLWMKSSEINGIGYNRHSDCPLKSVERLIERIEKSKVHDSSYMYDWLSYNKGLMDAVEYIKEYCEVSEDGY